MVPISSVRISRVPTYSGFRSLLPGFAYGRFTLSAIPFQIFRLPFRHYLAVLTPSLFLIMVWASPISLATTLGITLVFFSSGYLDVSVPRVPLL